MLRRLPFALSIILLVCAGIRAVAIFHPLPRLLHDTLVYFPTLAWAVAGIPIVLACFRWKLAPRSIVLATLIAMAVNVAADFRPSQSRPAEAPPGHVVQLLSYNIYQARLADEEIVNLIRECRPDLLLLQEVPLWFFRGHELELRRIFRNVVYYNRLLIATDFDVGETARIDLSHGRSLLQVTLRIGGRRLDVFNTHLIAAMPTTFFRRLDEQQKQVDEVLAHLAKVNGPVVIAGDFNFPLHSICHRRFTDRYTSARNAAGAGFGYTFNAFVPITTIDHCFAGGDVQYLQWTPLSIRLSDHRPIAVRFVLIGD